MERLLFLEQDFGFVKPFFPVCTVPGNGELPAGTAALVQADERCPRCPEVLQGTEVVY